MSPQPRGLGFNSLFEMLLVNVTPPVCVKRLFTFQFVSILYLRCLLYTPPGAGRYETFQFSI